MNQETTPRESPIALDRLCQQHAAVAHAEETLRTQCQEMSRLLTELKNEQQHTHGHYLVELEVLRMGNECLQQLVAERDQQIAELNQRLLATAQGEPQVEALLGEVQSLRQQLQEKEALLGELPTGERAPAEALGNLADQDYEAELTQFRRQLEADRQVLNEEIEQLQARNAELNEVVREAELQLSRERAQLARERIQLDRLREEIRLDSERTQRDAEVRERLVAIDRLKEEVAERHRTPDPSSVTPPPTVQRASGSAFGRWRSMLKS